MGHYQRKPYKKHSHDPYDSIDIEKEYLNTNEEVDDFFDEESYIELNETNLLNEPDIVRQLRQEEIDGTLPLWILNQTEETKSSKTQPNTHNNQKSNTPMIMKQSYHESLEIAKKTLRKLPTKNKNSIQFQEE